MRDLTPLQFLNATTLKTFAMLNTYQKKNQRCDETKH